MKVAVISSSIFPSPPSGYAGLEVIAYLTATGLAAKGHEVALIAPEGSSCPGGTVIVNGPPGWREARSYDAYWHRLPEFDAVVDHSLAGDETLLVRINGQPRWISFEELYSWAEGHFTPLLDGRSLEIPVKGLEVPSAVSVRDVRWRPVSAVIRHKRKDKIHTVKVRGGHTVNVTAGHSVMIAGMNKLASARADECVGEYAAVAGRIPPAKEDRTFWPIEAKDGFDKVLSNPRGWVAKHPESPLVWPVPLTDEALILFGLWVGDGCYNLDSSVLLASGKDTKYVGDLVAKEFGTSCHTDGTWPDVKFGIHSVLLVGMMKSAGFTGYSASKVVPDWVFGLSRRQIGLFLRGYFSADGHMGKKLVAGSVNRNLIKQMSVLLALCGIETNIYRSDLAGFKSEDGSVGDFYELEVLLGSYKRFLKVVGFVQEERNERLVRQIDSRRNWKGAIPYSLVRERVLRRGAKSGHRLLSYSKLERKKGATTSFLFRKASTKWREITESVPTDREDKYVYDLSVPGSENFLVGSIFCHNSWEKWAYILKTEGKLKAPVLGVLHAPVNTMYGELPPVEKPCIVCISNDQADHFKALFNKDCRVCHNGIDLEFYKDANVPCTDRFLFLARFSSIKGPDLAIKACLEAGVGLDLVGDTSITNEPQYFEECKRLAETGRPGQIRIVGPATRGECVYWFSQAHCMLHPNLNFREPLGLAPLESQACGCPVIAWDYGAMRETVRHGETGFLVKSFEGLVSYIHAFNQKTPHGRDVMRQTAVDWAQTYSVQNMINRYEELCLEAVRTGGW